ncbi:MAG: MotA/TolQ/ExbB proton channel family protein [Phycisphaerales bacterium]|nr:MotA/TolQ/ExbB proton channel family protein [Phycisphaerales bacterium]
MAPAGFVTLAQDAANPIVAGGQLHSVWDFIVKGGPTMGAIIACSLVALAVVVERAIVLRRKAVIPPGFLEGLEAIGGDRQRALTYCEASGSPAGAVLAAAIRRRGQPEAAVEKAVEDAGRRELMRLRKRVRLLGVLPQVSTMLGLLGTIFGMIKTFQAIAVSGQALGKTELLAKGIFEAWTCTAAGLLVAIPVMIAYHIVLGKIDGLIVDLDKLAVDFVAGEHARATRPAAVAEAVREPSPSLSPAGAV